MSDRRAHQPGFGKRVACGIAGGLLVVVGVALLVLPGPGLLLVLGGLLVLSHGFPAVERYVDPVQDRAMKAAEESVSTPLRVAFSIAAGLALIAAGVVWGLRPTLPLGGWATGTSLILSGIILLALLVYSYRRVQAQRRSAPREPDGTEHEPPVPDDAPTHPAEPPLDEAAEPAEGRARG